MAYVTPNSRAVFYENTGLSPSHENTLYFASTSEKDNYFGNLGGLDTSKLYYQRENVNRIRVEIPIATLYDCDYMRFKNDSFENKWFYAFVTQINYINNATTEIVYELDYLMTWMGSFSMLPCYVERQHTRGDTIGANIADEGISCGPFIEEGTYFSDNFGAGNCRIRIQYTNPDEIQSDMVGGIYTPLKTETEGSAGNATQVIQDLVENNLVDNIVNVFMVPTKFSGDGYQTVDYEIEKPYSDISGYVPKNNKLFCYPYKYMEVDNSEGSTKMFKYEYFNNLPDATSTGKCQFRVSGNTINRVDLLLLARNYNGFNGYNYTNALTMTQFPTCAWSTDIYQAYLAQKNAFMTHDTAQTVAGTALGTLSSIPSNALSAYNTRTNSQLSDSKYNSNVLNTVGGAASAGALIGSMVAPGVGTAVGAVGGALLGYGANVGMSYLSSVTSNMIDNNIQPEAGSRISGQAASDTMFSAGKKQFTFHKMCITKNYAIMIDNYFTMYGYKIRQVLTPNMNARPHFTYVKTLGCNVEGNVPAYDKQIIEQIFDNGVRLWHNLSEMGDYTLDNSPS